MATIGRLAYQVVADTQQFAQGMVATRSEIKQARQLFLDSRTPAEQFGMAMDALTRQFNKGLLDVDSYGRSVTRLKVELAEMDGSAERARAAQRALNEEQRKAAQVQQQLAARGRSVFESTRTSAERYAATVRDLQHLLRQGAINQDTFNRAIRQAQGAFTQAGSSSNVLRSALAGTASGSRLLALAMNPVTLAVVALTATATAATAAVGALAAGLGVLISKSVQSAANFEQTSVAFRVMLGSAEEAQKLLERIEDFTKSTPFEFDEVTQAARKLLGFGFAAGEIIPLLRRLGDLSAGLQIPIGELAAIYGKVQQKGRLFAEELNQLAERGIPVVALLAQQFGVTEQEVRKLAEQGKVSFSDFQQAIETMTDAGGQFAGMTQAQADTVMGAWSNLKDEISAALRQIGQEILAGFDLKGAIIGISQFAQTLVTAILPIFRILADDAQMIFASFGGFDAATLARGIAMVADFVHAMALAWQLVNIWILWSLSSYLKFQSAIGLGGAEWAKELDKTIGGLMKDFNRRSLTMPSEAVEDAIEEMRRKQNEGKPEDGSPNEDAEKRKREAEEAKKAAAEAQKAAEAAKEAARLQSEVARDARRVYEETRTPLERFNAKFADLTKLVSIGAIDWETYRRAVAAAKDELKKADEAASGAAERQRELEQNAKQFTDAAKTPLEKYQEEVKRIKDTFAAGLITEGVATNALERAGKEFAKATANGTIPGFKAPAAGSNKTLEAGTAEAFSEVLRHQRGGDKPNQKLENINQEQLTTLEEIKAEIQKERFKMIAIAI